MLSHIERLVKTNADLEGPLKAHLILANEPHRVKLNEQLERLQNAIFRVNRNIEIFDAALAPVRRLSLDVLLEIFHLCVPTKSSPQRRRELLHQVNYSMSYPHRYPLCRSRIVFSTGAMDTAPSYPSSNTSSSSLPSPRGVDSG